MNVMLYQVHWTRRTDGTGKTYKGCLWSSGDWALEWARDRNEITPEFIHWVQPVWVDSQVALLLGDRRDKDPSVTGGE